MSNHEVDAVLSKPHPIWLKNFTPKVRFTIDEERYIIKTAENAAELEEVLKLRYEVFMQEDADLLDSGLDFDAYDIGADYLTVWDKKIGGLVGTYRVICSKFSDRFYTESEFNIEKLLREVPGIKVELSRACIRKTHRAGVVMQLLWRAIARYIKGSGANYLFGCSSVPTQKPIEAAAIYLHLKQCGIVSKEALVIPREEYLDPMVAECLEFLSLPEYEFKAEVTFKKLPPLFKGYIKFGSIICGLPAKDQNFQCYDFVTLQDVEAFGQKNWNIYG